MSKLVMSVAAVVAVMALLVTGAVPAYAAACPEPGEMVPATIDIRPGGYPNPVNLRSEGLVPVALLGSETFDVYSVDLSTVRFHPMGRCEQAATAVKHVFTDVNKDGYGDILFHFVTGEVGFQAGDTAACLHGDLTGGQHFCGHDAIVVVGH